MIQHLCFCTQYDLEHDSSTCNENSTFKTHLTVQKRHGTDLMQFFSDLLYFWGKLSMSCVNGICFFAGR